MDAYTVGCGLCTKGCRQKALEMVDRKIVYKKDLCVNCPNKA